MPADELAGGTDHCDHIEWGESRSEIKESASRLGDNKGGEYPNTGASTTPFPAALESAKGTDIGVPIFVKDESQLGMAGTENSRFAFFRGRSFFTAFRVAQKCASPIPYTTPPTHIEIK